MRLIDADALKRKIMEFDEKYDNILPSMIMEAIEDAPTSDDGRIGVIDNVIDRAQKSLATEATSWRCLSNGQTILVTVVAEVIEEDSDGVD